MSRPITAPGWYRLGTHGLERVCGLAEDPGGDLAELVKVEIGEELTEEPLW